MTNYATQLDNWLHETMRDFRDYVPRDYPMQFFSSDVTDEAKYVAALGLYNTIKSNMRSSYRQTEAKHDDGKEMFYLVPHVEPNGNVYFIDRFRNRVVASMFKQPNGLFSFYGPRYMMTVLGGRGELGDLLRRTEDGEFFYDRKKAA